MNRVPLKATAAGTEKPSRECRRERVWKNGEERIGTDTERDDLS